MTGVSLSLGASREQAVDSRTYDCLRVDAHEARVHRTNCGIYSSKKIARFYPLGYSNSLFPVAKNSSASSFIGESYDYIAILRSETGIVLSKQTWTDERVSPYDKIEFKL